MDPGKSNIRFAGLTASSKQTDADSGKRAVIILNNEV
jgi:hypothetical protein